MKKDYIKPFVKVKEIDTELCQMPITSATSESISADDAGAKEFFDFFE